MIMFPASTMAAMSFMSVRSLIFFIVFHRYVITNCCLNNRNAIFDLKLQTSKHLHPGFVDNFVVVNSPWNVCRLKSKHLMSSGFFKSKVALTKYSKHGLTSLAIPGHDPPIDITISMDIHSNPGPTLLNNDSNINAPIHDSSWQSFRPPNVTYSSYELFDIRRQSKMCAPCSLNCCFSKLKQFNIFRFRGKRGGCHTRMSSSTKSTSSASTK